MVKRISHISLSFLLLIATAGFAVSKHYCGEDLVSVNLFNEAESCCDDGNCCHNETVFYQVGEDFAVPGFIPLPHVYGVCLFPGLPDESFGRYCRHEKTDSDEEREIPPRPKIHEILSLKQTWLL
jgi:hypothetical protein